MNLDCSFTWTVLFFVAASAHLTSTRISTIIFMSAPSSQPELHETPNTTPPVMSATATPNPDDFLSAENRPENEVSNEEPEPMEVDPNESEAINGQENKDKSINGQDQSEAMEEDEPEDSESTLSLPISKIKTIFKMDPDYVSASSGALYATGLATELFVQYLVEQASVSARMEKRKKLQYKDFSSAVSMQEALHFLSDTVPKSQPIGELIQQQKINVNTDQPDIFADDSTKEQDNNTPVPTLPKGQQTLSFGAPNPAPVKKAVIQNLMADDNE